ncbi:MAG: hypothetical protein K8S20_15315 [Chloroflexi bacterium]|nr:hypothetical protein [Chloroflexota bacterium]
MKKMFPLFVALVFVFSACAPATPVAEPAIAPANTATLPPAETFTPEPTSTPALAPTPTLAPDTMIYQFDTNVSDEDRVTIKEGVKIARQYLVNNFGRDIQGKYVINVANNPSDQSDVNFARVNGDGVNQIMTLNVGHQWWAGENKDRRIKAVVHEFTHFWQSEQGNGWPGCKYLQDALGLPGSHDPMTDVFDEGHAEYVGFMAVGLENEAFTLNEVNMVSVLAPVSRDLKYDYSARKAGVYWLIKQKGPMAFSRYCAEIGNGKTFPEAFQIGFGMPFEKFTEDFKSYLFEGLSELCSQNSACDKQKLTAVWQSQEGCFAFIKNSLSLPIDFLNTGYPHYIVAIADGKEDEIYPGLALGIWQANQWNENVWFVDNEVSAIAFKNLFDKKGVESFVNYCNEIGKGAYPKDAFKSAFGMTLEDFRTQFKKEVLGEMADCTVAKCGGGVDNYSDIYKLKHLIDITKSEPNLILNFIDENNQPVALTHLTLWRQDFGGDGQVVDYAQPFTTPPTFSVAILPGRYIFAFCEPGYPVDHSDWECQWHETDWIDVYNDKVTNLTFQVLPGVRKADLTKPDIEVRFTDKDGNPIPNLGIQICNLDTSVKVCTPTYPIAKTDADGVYTDFLRNGKYLIRVPLYPNYLRKYEFAPFYEIKDINVDENSIALVNFQFPVPNLIVKFLDVNGSPVPEHGFQLCKIINGKGNCATPVSLWGWYAAANKKGVFEGFVEPGEYYILTCKLPDCPEYEIKITNIIVSSETEVTTVEYPLYK